MSLPRVEFQGRPVIELRSGPSRALICPEAGGRLLLWEIDGRRIIHWPEPADWSRPAKIRGGNPILFPFIARHYVDGVMDKWRDSEGTVRDMPMHGFARTSPFTLLASSDETTAVMELQPDSETRIWYPFEFRFRVIYHLAAQQLGVRFETENCGPAALPYYAGHHFYFALPESERADWRLHLPPVRQSRQAPDGPIVSIGTTTTDFLLKDPALQDVFHILQDKGNPTIRHPDGRSMEFDLDPSGVPWQAVTTWTEKPDSPFYCIEPWLGLPNAIHHGRGLRWLAPGTGESAVCTIRASGW